MHEVRVGLKGRGPLPHTILTTVKRLLLLGLLAVAVAAPAAPAASTPPRVLAIHFVEEVNPVTQDWLNNQLDRAAEEKYDAAVIVLDTPGGLSESMLKVVKKELSLPIPVVVYVAPNGARAASAGVWISQAADILAMAPETKPTISQRRVICPPSSGRARSAAPQGRGGAPETPVPFGSGGPCARCGDRPAAPRRASRSTRRLRR